MLLCVAQASAEAPRPYSEKLEVRAIRAYFYYPAEGTFDFEENGLNDGTAALRNVVSGGGAAKHATSSTLVLVDVTAPYSEKREGFVELVALEARRELHRSKVPLDAITLGRDGGTTVPFLVHGTGCEDLKLFAILESGGKRADASTAIPFHCGE